MPPNGRPPAPRDRPHHPMAASIILVVGVLVLIIVLALASSGS